MVEKRTEMRILPNFQLRPVPIVMHQSFVTTTPPPPRNSGNFDLLSSRGEYRQAKPYRDILRYGDSVLRYVLNTYWIASKGIEMDFWGTFIPVQ